MKDKKQIIGRYIFAFVLIGIGIILNYYNMGKEFLGFNSVGTWMTYVGFIILVIITLQIISNRKRIIDERMKTISFQASRITFVLMIFAAFAIMIIDGIKTIEISYHLFMSYVIAYMMLIYFIAYKILEKYY